MHSFAIALASFNETAIDDLSPVLSGTLETGERIQVVMYPATEKDVISVTLRKPSKSNFNHAAYIEQGFYQKVITPTIINEDQQDLIHLYTQKRWPLLWKRP